MAAAEVHRTERRSVWVSGAAGKVGAAVIEALRADGADVIAVDRAGGGNVSRLDLCDYAATKASMTGATEVIHLAAVPSPENIAPTELVENNVLSTFNVFESAWELGLERVVTASSGAIYGYSFSPTLIAPAAFPIGEDTPFDYVDPYALTKELGERIGQMYARRGMSVIALRPHWILAEEDLRHYRETLAGEAGARNLWGYVELGDAARAFCLAAGADVPRGEFHPLLIVAADTMVSTPTIELLQEWFPGVERRKSFPGTSGLFDCSRAQRLIHWEPSFTW